MNMKIEPYWNDDHTKYAVLVSNGFGAGWSSWGESELAYDKRIVQFWLDHKDNKKWMEDVSWMNTTPAAQEAEDFFTSLGYDYIYMGGFNNIELVWVPVGVHWRIKEYDGAEYIEYRDDIKWNVFN